MDGIDQVHAPVGHGAARVIPEISKRREPRDLHAPAVSIEGHVRRRPQPHLPVEALGNRSVRRLSPSLLADGSALPRMAERHLSDQAALDDLGSPLEIPSRALHGARLDDALVCARRLHHLLPLVHVHGCRFLYEDILALLACLDGHVGVPVIRRRDADGVDGLVLEDFAEVLDRLHGLPGLGGGGDGFFQRRPVHVTDRDRFDIGQLQRVAEIARPHRPHADVADGDAVVRASDTSGEDGGGQRGDGAFEDVPSIDHGLSPASRAIHVQGS